MQHDTSIGSKPLAQPFRIAVPQDALDDLHLRLSRIRWSDAIMGSGWDDGTDQRFLGELTDHWQEGFDWREQENALNALPQFRATVGGASGLRIHFVHARAVPDAARRQAVVLLHGWPSLFHQMSKVIPLLTNVSSQESHSQVAFDVVVPSLPGFGFSDRPGEHGTTLARTAQLTHELMTGVLGYARYGVVGGDIGAVVARQIVSQFPTHVTGLMTHGDSPNIVKVPSDLSSDEQQFVDRSQTWMRTEGGYLVLQATKPQTLAAGLADSPAGLASWLVEKYRAWSDCGLSDGSRDVLRRFSLDELLTFISIYWFTGTIGSSIRTYRENFRQPSVYSPSRPTPEEEPPFANLVWPGDISQPPREWSARRGRLTHYEIMPRGGHFPEWEEPQLVADQIRSFFGLHD